MAVENSSSLLSRLRRVVRKVKFLLNFGIISRWRVSSLIRAGSSNRWLTSQESLGLRAAYDDDHGGDGRSSQEDSVGSSRSPGIMRTTSCPSDDDVDKRAEIFIANFYRQLRIERQVSLELKYYRGNSFEDRFSP